MNAVPKYDISFEFNECFASCFDLDDYKIVDDKFCAPYAMGSLPLQFCEGVSGFKFADWAKEIRPKIKRYNEIKTRFCKRK